MSAIGRPLLTVLFRDERYVVVDKPAGMPAHPARGDDAPSVEDCLVERRRHGKGPWLAHRLDRDTAGCLVVALRRSALHAAQACFASGRAEKVYWATVVGRPDGTEGEIRSCLARVQRGRSWRMEPVPSGAMAITRWRLLGADGPTARLELRPLTGRTHQVRAHCAQIGCPILGDPIYGSPSSVRLNLLARSIRLPVQPPVEALAPLPPHFLANWPTLPSEAELPQAMRATAGSTDVRPGARTGSRR